MFFKTNTPTCVDTGQIFFLRSRVPTQCARAAIYHTFLYRTFFITSFIFFGFSGLARAQYIPEFYQSVRGAGAGNALTAITNDAESVFYNPAGLALIPQGEIRLINPTLETSQDATRSVSKIRGVMDGVTYEKINDLKGKNLSARFSVLPGIAFPGFFLGYLNQHQAGLSITHDSLPITRAYYFKDTGIISGFAFESRGILPKHYLRLGTAFKYIERSGFQTSVNALELINGGLSNVIENAKAGPARGYGVNLGLQYEIGLSPTSQLILGSAWQDIGDTKFTSTNDLGSPPSILNNLSAGFGFVQQLSRSKKSNVSEFRFSAEMRRLNQSLGHKLLKLHLGTELDFGIIGAQFGYNQDGFTMGGKLDLGIFEVTAASYSVEHGTSQRENRERRYIAQITFKFGFLGLDRKSQRSIDRRRSPRK